MSNIKITLKGLSIVYLVENIWKIVFICDNTHPINFKWKKNDEQWSNPITLAPVRTDPKKQVIRTIIIDMKEPKPLTQVLDYPPEMFDFTAEYAHKNGINWNDSGELDLAYMSMPNATLRTSGLSKDPYQIKIAESLSSTASIIGQVTRKLEANIEINSGGSIQIVTDDGIEATPPLPFESGTNYSLYFNNDCDKSTKDLNDFNKYYSLIEDAVDRTIKFSAGEKTFSAISEMFFINDLEAFIMTPGETNCDPGSGGRKPIKDFPNF